jgi:hypothetical protein
MSLKPGNVLVAVLRVRVIEDFDGGLYTDDIR